MDNRRPDVLDVVQALIGFALLFVAIYFWGFISTLAGH